MVKHDQRDASVILSVKQSLLLHESNQAVFRHKSDRSIKYFKKTGHLTYCIANIKILNIADTKTNNQL